MTDDYEAFRTPAFSIDSTDTTDGMVWIGLRGSSRGLGSVSETSRSDLEELR